MDNEEIYKEFYLNQKSDETLDILNMIPTEMKFITKIQTVKKNFMNTFTAKIIKL